MSAPESTRRRAPSMPRPARRDEKRVYVERLLRAWKATRHTAFMGFIAAATGGSDLAFVDDETVVMSAELYASKRGGGMNMTMTLRQEMQAASPIEGPPETLREGALPTFRVELHAAVVNTTNAAAPTEFVTIEVRVRALDATCAGAAVANALQVLYDAAMP